MKHILIIFLLAISVYGQTGGARKSVLTQAQKNSIKQLYSDTYSIYSLDNFAGANDSIKLASALSTLDENATIYFPEGTHDVGAQTIDCNIIIASGGILTTTYGQVKITGTIQDCLYQIFESPTYVPPYYLQGKIDLQLAQIVCVRPEWWGAKVNDDVSDLKAMQLASNTGKNVSFIQGTYLIDSTYNMQSRTINYGAGGLRGEDIRTSTRSDGTVIKLMDHSNYDMITLQGGNIGTVVRDITFKGNGDNQDVPINIMELTNAIVRVYDCTFDSSSGNGIYYNSNTYNNINSIVSGCTFVFIDSAAIYTEGSGTGIHIQNNAFDDCYYGAYINSSEWGTFTENNLERCPYGVKTKGTFTIENNYFTRCDSAAIYVYTGARTIIGKQLYNLCGYNTQFQDGSFGNKLLYDYPSRDSLGRNHGALNASVRFNLILPASDSTETFNIPIAYNDGWRRLRKLVCVPSKNIYANDSVYCKLDFTMTSTSYGSVTFDDTSWSYGSQYTLFDTDESSLTYVSGQNLIVTKTITQPTPTLGSNEIPDSASIFDADGTDWWTGSRVTLTWDSDSTYMVATVNDTLGTTAITMADSLTIGTKYRVSFKAKSADIVADFDNNFYWQSWSVIKNPTISEDFQEYEFSGFATRGKEIITISGGTQVVGRSIVFDDISVKEIISEQGMETPHILVYIELGE